MSDKILTPYEAFDYLKETFSKTITGVKEVLEMSKWICEWNEGLPDDNRIICYIREYVNVGYVIDRGNNRYKQKKPNFMVIKLEKTDFEIKTPHVDFYLTELGYRPCQKYLAQRKESNPVRWVIDFSDCESIGIENLKKLVITSYEKRGGNPNK